jgi:glycosyltransferase involved in cell wall biosynthesis
VTVYTAQPSYNDLAAGGRPWRETVGGVKIRRVRLLPERKRFFIGRLLNSLFFLARAVGHACLRRRYDLVLANAHPPLLAGGALWLINRLVRKPYVLHLQDIHPECLRVVGKLRDGAAYRLARRLDAQWCRRAARLVTLSDDMADSLAARGLDRRQMAVINNSPLPVEKTAGELPPLLADGDQRPQFLFAGNVGGFQALDLVVEAARQLARRREFRLVFLGAGVAKARLTAAAGDQLGRTIHFLPHVAPETAVAAMRRADFGIVSLAPEAYRYAYPSKSMTYLAAGCPVVAVVEPASQLARTVRERQLGYVAAEHSATAIAQVMERACDERHQWTADRRRELTAACNELFGEKQMLDEWMQLLEELACRPACVRHARAA